MRLLLLLSLSLAAAVTPLGAAPEAPEAGPENGGLRLRLTVTPRSEPTKEGFKVRLEVTNATEQSVTLQAAYPFESSGDLKAYLEAGAGIECVPTAAPWIGGVAARQRISPQPQQALRGGETLTVEWQTDGRRLKNRVTDPGKVQNPELTFSGLYSIHATLTVVADGRAVRLRSNEQLVPVGGSRAMPKHTYGRLWFVDPETKTARLSLGSLHKVVEGDRFEIGSPKGGHWKLTITQVDEETSTGRLEVLTTATFPGIRSLPSAQMDAKLMLHR